MSEKPNVDSATNAADRRPTEGCRWRYDRAARGDGVLDIIAESPRAPFSGHAARRVAPVREVERGRLRHAIAERRVVQSALHSSHWTETDCVSRLLGPT